MIEKFEQARDELKGWQSSRPENFWQSNPFLQNLLQFYLEKSEFAELHASLEKFGRTCATEIDRAAIINDQIGNHPQLKRWNEIGEEIDEIEFHPSYHQAGRPAIESGILALQQQPGNALKQAAYFFLLSHCGEMGHACPIACTSGMIRALQYKGSKSLQERYLPGLLTADYDRCLIAAQFVTEVQGGSDVGANACEAIPVEGHSGMWLINGEKWFCSVANADLFLISARPVGAQEGTKGLGAFVVPRRLEDGSLNGLHIRRLKDKFGTRTLATAEIDFESAIGYQLGQIDEGFKIIIEMVLNVSRWLNAVGSMGLLQRGYYEALAFARHRQAFGGPIIQYPLVQEALAEIKSSLYAGMAATFRLSHLIDRIDLGQASDREKAVYRLMVNINKYNTSIAASLGLRRAQEIFGGNGAVETFTVIPRLYRDSVVFESWEGSHNVLCLQVLKDCRKYNFHQDFFAYIHQELEKISEPKLKALRVTCLEYAQQISRALQTVLAADPGYAQLHIRRVVDRMALVFQATCLLTQADWEIKQGIPTDIPKVLQFFLNRNLQPGYDPGVDENYLHQIREMVGF